MAHAQRHGPPQILPQGSFEPMYRLPLEVGSGETPVLPLSIYGSVALARPAGSSDISSVSSGSFFIYLFDPQQAGLAGLSFDEGLYGTLGYVTDGQEVLRQGARAVAEAGDASVACTAQGADGAVPATPPQADPGGRHDHGREGGAGARPTRQSQRGQRIGT